MCLKGKMTCWGTVVQSRKEDNEDLHQGPAIEVSEENEVGQGSGLQKYS